MSSTILLKIKDFETLQSGWHYGEGVSFSSEVISNATEIASSLISHGFSKLDAFPAINGEIRVTSYDNDRYLEFTIESYNLVTYLQEYLDITVDYRESITLPDCFNIIETLDMNLCN